MLPTVSRRLDLPIAVLAWLAGFQLLRLTGSWLPLALMAIVAAARLLVGDVTTRRLLKLHAGAVLLGLLGAAVLITGTFVLYRPLTQLFPALRGETQNLYALLRSAGVGQLPLATLTVVLSISEEIIWRGRVLASPADATPRSWPTGGQWLRIVGAAAIYGAAHIASGSITLMAVAFLCGCFWGALRLGTRSLWTSVIAHVSWDVFVMILSPLA